MAEEFPTEWITQIQDMVTNNQSLSLANAAAIPRVATTLMVLKPDAYIPHFLSLGPYHHWKLDKDFESSSVRGGCYQYPELKMSTAEAYKVQSAAPFWQRGHNHGRRLHDIVKETQGMQQEIERFYDWSIISREGQYSKNFAQRFYDWSIFNREGQYSKNFALMMTIDAYFLFSFLFRLSGDDRRDDRDMVSLSTLDVCIKCDILKLENQIPLSLLKLVFDDQESETDHQDFKNMLVLWSKFLSPFDFVDTISTHNQIDMANERHLLGFMHSLVSPFLHMQASPTDDGVDRRTLLQSTKHLVEGVVAAVLRICVKHPTDEGQRDFKDAYNAGKMVKAGIKFKSFSKPPHRIRFDTKSGTLYLPRITVSHMQSEVFLRNMMALEFNDATGRNQVTRYVGLMDCIIDTAEDVRVLRDSDVIHRGSLVLTDEWIAKMWNGMCHPFFTGQLEPHDDLKAALEEVLITKYCMSRLKKVLWEVYWDHLSKPGKRIALLVGILLVAMTVVQTYCNLYQLRHPEA